MHHPTYLSVFSHKNPQEHAAGVAHSCGDGILFLCLSRYFAYSEARLSRMTLTLICPG